MGGVSSTYGGEERSIQDFGGETEGTRPLGRPWSRWDNIKMDLQEVECEGVDWTDLALDRGKWGGSREHRNEPSNS